VFKTVEFTGPGVTPQDAHGDGPPDLAECALGSGPYDAAESMLLILGELGGPSALAARPPAGNPHGAEL